MKRLANNLFGQRWEQSEEARWRSSLEKLLQGLVCRGTGRGQEKQSHGRMDGSGAAKRTALSLKIKLKRR